INRNTLLIAAVAGPVYLMSEITLGAMDIAWFIGKQEWEFRTNAIYITLSVMMVISFSLFARGFIALSILFENTLLKVIAYVLIVATIGMGVLDVSSLAVRDVLSLWIPYAAGTLLLGGLSIVFGIALIRLQDSMGEVSRIAGILEIVMGCLLATVVLFFVTYMIMVPAVALEIVVLYRGYEYVSRYESGQTNAI
ncbi:MAG: hypothetical protein ACOYXT_30575, partial [Bacteroidota bacterium]